MELFEAVMQELDITWDDISTKKRIDGYIARGKARLEQIAGAPLNFDEEGEPRRLLLDYCRYANSRALEAFERNFASDLLSLHLNAQVKASETENAE